MSKLWKNTLIYGGLFVGIYAVILGIVWLIVSSTGMIEGSFLDWF